MLETVLPFDELPPERQASAGGKGGTLARLHRAGYPAPDGLVILPTHGLELAFHHISHDWQDAEGLIPLLADKEDCIVTCASEGGLFEYGSDKEIERNLDVLYEHAPDGMRIAGTVVHEPSKVHPTVPAMAKAANAGLGFLGVSGLAAILAKTGWGLESVQEENPIYAVFTLKKDRAPAV